MLFVQDIHDWSSWGRVYQSIEAFDPLIKYIFQKHNLRFAKIEHCTPGTNAVFKVGGLIVKIFAPNESGMDTDSDYKTELFGMERANRLGISAPKIAGSGYIQDKYFFRYLVMEYVSGASLGKLEINMTDVEKYEIGKQLRVITDKLNTTCERFNDYDIVQREMSNERWDKFPESFKAERNEYLKRYKRTNVVYVHGDLNPDNVLVGKNGKLYIIDFADAVMAPPEYELAAVICELFCFEKPYMDGYFGDYNEAELTERCFKGLLLHDFGYNIIRCNLGKIEEITSLGILKKRLYTAIKTGKQIGDAE